MEWIKKDRDNVKGGIKKCIDGKNNEKSINNKSKNTNGRLRNSPRCVEEGHTKRAGEKRMGAGVGEGWELGRIA